MDIRVPPVAFLGICNRAANVRNGNTNFFEWNVLGLKDVVLSYIAPINLLGYYVGISVFVPALQDTKFLLKLGRQNGEEIGSYEINFEGYATLDNHTLATKEDAFGLPQRGWGTVFFPISEPAGMLTESGLYEVILECNGEELLIGQFRFQVINPEPLTAERVNAIKSSPSATKTVRLEICCNKCGDCLKTFASLEMKTNKEEENYLWYEHLPDTFHCSCGATTIDLRIIKKNLHGLLGQPLGDAKSVSFTPLYEVSALEMISNDFFKLIESNPREEIVQKFIEDNPVLLHQFPAQEIYFKPPLLTFYNADFGLVTPQRELLLIELEKPSTKLLKKDGGINAELQHAFDQVNNWLHIVNEHRIAVLDSLRIKREEVASVKAVVIAGRDKDYDKEHIRRLKGTDFGRVVFLTYDDLLASLNSLIKRIKSL